MSEISLISFIGSPIDNSRRNCCTRAFGAMKRGSLRKSIFSLLFSLLNPSCIVLALMIKNTGLSMGLLMIFISFIISYISLSHLSSAVYKNQIFDYYNLSFQILGKYWGILIGITMIVHWSILVVSYQVLLGIFIPYVFKPLSLKLSTKDEKIYSLILSNTFITLPLSMFKDLDNTNVTKVINCIGILFILSINLYRFIFDWQIDCIDWFTTDLISSSIFLCALQSFSAYYYLPQILEVMYEPNPTRSKKTIFRGFLLLTIILAIFTISGYLSSPYFHASWTSISGEMMLVFNLLALIPTTVVTLRNIVLDLFDYDPGIMM